MTNEHKELLLKIQHHAQVLLNQAHVLRGENQAVVDLIFTIIIKAIEEVLEHEES